MCVHVYVYICHHIQFDLQMIILVGSNRNRNPSSPSLSRHGLARLAASLMVVFHWARCVLPVPLAHLQLDVKDVISDGLASIGISFSMWIGRS